MIESLQRKISGWHYRQEINPDKHRYLTLPRLFLIFVAFFLFYRLFQNALIDDAFITLDYVKTITRSGEWGFFPGHVTNTATSPLNVIILSGIGLVLGCRTTLPVFTAAFCAATSLYYLEKISLELFSTRKYGTVGALALVLNPLLISTLGMESLLFGMLIIIPLFHFLKKNWLRMSFFLGLLTLTRPDGLIYALVFICFIPLWLNRFKSILIFSLTILPWYLFSWIHLGSLFPDTLIIKVTQPKWGPYVFSNGLKFYFLKYPFETFLSLIFLTFIFALVNKQVRQNKLIQILLLTAILQFSGYSLLNVAPYHWYYAPAIINLTVFSCLSLGILSSQYLKKTAARVAVLLFGLIPAIGLGQWLLSTHFTIKEMPIHSNWAAKTQYQEIGLWLKKECGNNPILLEGEIGTLVYYSDCYVLDSFSDRTWLQNMVQKLKSGDGLLSAVFRFNYFFLQKESTYPPPKYKLTVNHGEKNIPQRIYMKWVTSTRWAPSSLVIIQEIQ
jgi:hypothetical protein